MQLPQNVVKDTFLPFHPGAVRYYRESTARYTVHRARPVSSGFGSINVVPALIPHRSGARSTGGAVQPMTAATLSARRAWPFTRLALATMIVLGFAARQEP
jgi:hypothetical protein